MKCSKCNADNPDTQSFCGECGTQLVPSKDMPVSPTKTLETPKEELTTGSTFAGRYQIIEELGKGGMGKVYRAFDKKLNEEVALKLIRPEIASDKKTVERFSNELKLARKISHRNVGRMYELMEEKGAYFITMEYVSGEDLKSFIKRSRQLNVGTALVLAKQVCEGLVEAHRLGVIHRDLKPQNVMIDKEGNARILDFGIARSIKAKGITRAGMIVGTPEYMSPEQAEAKEVDNRSDIYSMGVILYEMVTGQLPFIGDTPLAVAMKHKGEAPQDPRDLNSQIPEDLSFFILRCMAKNKDERYQSAEEAHSELEKVEQGIPTTERIVPKRKPTTSREITVTFGLKKLFIPVLIVVAFAIITVIILMTLPEKKNSIAVLPFSDLSPQKDQEVLCDGMTDEIISKLSILEGWKVMNMTSVMQYKNTVKDIKEIGRELDVATILEGRVRKEKDDIRVTAQLVDATDGFQIWSNTYEQKLERVFDIQSDIAEKITAALKTKLSPEEKRQISKKPTENMEAYNFYLQGRWFWNRRTPEGFQKAIEYFERAIEIDPNYALAYSGLADSYLLSGYYGRSAQDYKSSKEAALKAIQIDDSLAEPHASLAVVTWSFECKWEEAEREYKRALELNPNYATAHHWYAYYLVYIGRSDEAIQEIKLALELDPLSIAINRDLGEVLYLAHRYEEAVEAMQRVIEMDPNFPVSHAILGWAYLKTEKYENAIEAFQKEKQGVESAEQAAAQMQIILDAYIGLAYAGMGRKEEAREIMGRMNQTDGLYYHKALLSFFLGHIDEGFEYLEKESKLAVNFIILLYVDPLVDSVRSDPRFKELLKTVGLE